jgi:hypothetical protein
MKVDPDQIREHAKRVDQVAIDVGAAGDDGGTTIDGEAFGVLCGFLAGVVTETGASLVTTIGSTTDTLTLTSEGLREMAAQYDIDDDSAKARMMRFHLGDGDGLPR